MQAEEVGVNPTTPHIWKIGSVEKGADMRCATQWKRCGGEQQALDAQPGSCVMVLAEGMRCQGRRFEGRKGDGEGMGSRVRGEVVVLEVGE